MHVPGPTVLGTLQLVLQAIAAAPQSALQHLTTERQMRKSVDDGVDEAAVAVCVSQSKKLIRSARVWPCVPRPLKLLDS